MANPAATSRSRRDRLTELTWDWVPDYQQWRWESWLLEFDTTDLIDHPPRKEVGYLYVLGLSEDWIKVGITQDWSARRRTLCEQLHTRHGLQVEREWKTAAITTTAPLDSGTNALRRAETRVLDYARQLADQTILFYRRGRRGTSTETEMFHGAGFGMARAFADVIGRCETYR